MVLNLCHLKEGVILNIVGKKIFLYINIIMYKFRPIESNDYYKNYIQLIDSNITFTPMKI